MTITRKELTRIRDTVGQSIGQFGTPGDMDVYRMFGSLDDEQKDGLARGLNFALANCLFPEDAMSPWHPGNEVPPCRLVLMDTREENEEYTARTMVVVNVTDMDRKMWNTRPEVANTSRWMEIPD